MAEQTTDSSDLFPEFPPVPREEWEAVIEKDLNGADYTEKLRWNTGEGLAPLPFYRREDLEEDENREPLRPSGDWTIAQQIYSRQVEEANRESRQALEGGAGALRYQMRIEALAGALGGDMSGLPLRSQKDLENLLDGIPLPETPLHFDASMASPALLAMVRNELDRRNGNPAELRLTLLHDPFAFMLEEGHLPREGESPTASSGQLLQYTREEGLARTRCLGVDLRLCSRAGGTLVQELSLALSTASGYLARLSGEGFKPSDIAAAVHFCFPVGSLYFPEIAKFRALRILWQNLCRAYGVEKVPPALIHAESSTWNKTLYDPHTNLLRNATEGMSAALAGCDTLVLHPFDHPFGETDTFSRRISRNAQVIMKEEAHLDKVADPSAGSWYVERLTSELAKKAWRQFREIEQQGGLLQSIRDGFVQSAIRASREERDRAIAFRKRVFVGTNRYPNTGEEAKTRTPGAHSTVSISAGEEEYEIDSGRLVASMAEALKEGAGMGDLAGYMLNAGRQETGTLNPYRGAEAFEAIRLATERHERTPMVLTLPLGNRKARKARSSFAVNMLGCAGYDIEDPLGFDTVEEALERVRETGPDLAVLCSSDREYPQLAGEIVAGLDEMEEPPLLVLAAPPEDRYRKLGIEHYIHARCNVLETLYKFQNILGVIGEE